ncbi:sensor histidine kinase [Paenibacillus albus]|uniref:histidine kinase n=1 Tax=Paenibacillus albus TaxID=2495582 RepID=A0A3S9A0T9_9BACL|nr:sensor histidine kinase [Paenibacillus albus]AZN39306.1 sensor histidine kinase [Paenibacillus albus]
MSWMRSKLSPTVARIVVLSVLLTLACQVALVYIGLTYAGSIGKTINAKRVEGVLDQFQKNMQYQLSDVNNLLLLLQTPEFNDFFKNQMTLRDEFTVAREEQKLLSKLNGLHLSPSMISSIYFIGADINQQSLRKITNSSRFEKLPHLQTEVLRSSGLEELFLPSHDQFTVYTKDDFSRHFHTDNKLLTPENINGLSLFIHSIQDHLVITNGNENGVFIFIVLDDRFFNQALPLKKIAHTQFSLVGQDNRVLWSTAENQLKQAIVSGVSAKSVSGTAYTNTIKDLFPFKLRIVYSEEANSHLSFKSSLMLRMIGVALVTLFMTLFISLFYLKKVFKPFRIISRKIKNQPMSHEDDLVLRSLPEHIVRKGFHSISMRNKLILVLFLAVSLPAITDGVLYARFLSHDVKSEMVESTEEIGSFSVVSIRNRVRSMETMMNEIAVSQNFRDYFLKAKNPVINENGSSYRFNLSVFPGLDDVAYFVLLDENGSCIYSSVYSNNREFFNMDDSYLLADQDGPYWISGFKDVFHRSSTAVVKRIDSIEQSGNTYLLLVPKESVFKNVESGFSDAFYSIQDEKGLLIYQSAQKNDLSQHDLLRFSERIPEMSWHLRVDYMFGEVLEKNSVYQEQFLLSIVIEFMASIVVAFFIANLLFKPIKELRDAMERAGAGRLASQVASVESNEIGDIIRSYNSMIARLDQTVRENMSIMEENAATKIRENHLIAMKKHAELEMLQAQINPHFLYNTLETINMQSMKNGNNDISTIVGSLADLLRYSISKGADMSLLAHEMNHAMNYCTIQQIRFGYSFSVEWDIPEELRNVRVLRFILQPLIENAIKHGFAGWDSGGVIRVTAVMQGDWLHLTVSDNGAGMDKKTLARMQGELERDMDAWRSERAEGVGIGLSNVYHRLKLFYKDQMTMQITSGLMKGTVIQMAFVPEN